MSEPQGGSQDGTALHTQDTLVHSARPNATPDPKEANGASQKKAQNLAGKTRASVLMGKGGKQAWTSFADPISAARPNHAAAVWRRETSAGMSWVALDSVIGRRRCFDSKETWLAAWEIRNKEANGIRFVSSDIQYYLSSPLSDPSALGSNCHKGKRVSRHEERTPEAGHRQINLLNTGNILKLGGKIPSNLANFVNRVNFVSKLVKTSK